jgi:glucosamine kinase
MTRVDRVVLGLTTAPADRYEQRELCSLVGRSVDARQVWLADDAVTTHVGALSLGWGLSVTVGTGVASLAMPEGDGRPSTISGHGFLLGDEGGAWWIGREGVRSVLRAHDGRGPATRLSGAAVARFGNVWDMSARIHALARPVNDIAHFAPEVLELAEAGDHEAERIVREAATELTAVVRAGCRAAGGKDAAPGSVPVAFGGRLLTPGTILRRWLEKSVAAELPQAATRDADGTPLDGAMRLGLEPGPGRYSAMVTRWADEL